MSIQFASIPFQIVHEKLIPFPLLVEAAFSMETFGHLFFDCRFTYHLWARLCSWIGHNRVIGDWRVEVQWACQQAKRKSGIGAIASCVFVMATALVFRERNKERFQSSRYDADHICREIVLHYTSELYG